MSTIIHTFASTNNNTIMADNTPNNPQAQGKPELQVNVKASRTIHYCRYVFLLAFWIAAGLAIIASVMEEEMGFLFLGIAAGALIVDILLKALEPIVESAEVRLAIAAEKWNLTAKK